MLTGLLRLFRVPWPATAEISLLLGPGGEFAFIVIGLAVAKDIVARDTGTFVLAITSFSMAIIPLLDYVGRRVAKRLGEEQEPNPALSIPPPQERIDAIVIGCGRVGRLVSEMLGVHKVQPHHRRERSGRRHQVARPRDGPSISATPRTPVFLRRCGIATAKGVIITVNKPSVADEIVDERARAARRHRHRGARAATRGTPVTSISWA